MSDRDTALRALVATWRERAKTLEHAWADAADELDAVLTASRAQAPPGEPSAEGVTFSNRTDPIPPSGQPAAPDRKEP